LPFASMDSWRMSGPDEALVDRDLGVARERL
jgi:hypothetical protein